MGDGRVDSSLYAVIIVIIIVNNITITVSSSSSSSRSKCAISFPHGHGLSLLLLGRGRHQHQQVPPPCPTGAAYFGCHVGVCGSDRDRAGLIWGIVVLPVTPSGILLPNSSFYMVIQRENRGDMG